MARVICCDFDLVGPQESAIGESELEKLLEDALRDGVIVQYDTGRGRSLWFSGQPGERFRALRAKVVAAAERARSLAGLPPKTIEAG